MPAKTWNFTLTPSDGPARTVHGLSHDEAVGLVLDLIYGRVESRDIESAPELARAA